VKEVTIKTNLRKKEDRGEKDSRKRDASSEDYGGARIGGIKTEKNRFLDQVVYKIQYRKGFSFENGWESDVKSLPVEITSPGESARRVSMAQKVTALKGI